MGGQHPGPGQRGQWRSHRVAGGDGEARSFGLPATAIIAAVASPVRTGALAGERGSADTGGDPDADGSRAEEDPGTS